MASSPSPTASGSREAAPAQTPAPRAHFTLRAVVLALLLIPLNAWWLIQTEYVVYADNATTSALFFNAVSLVLILLLVNAALGRLQPRWRFAPAELVVLYIVVSVA